MSTDHRATLAKIRRLDQLIPYLRDEMGWPITKESFEEADDLFYDFTPEELGIEPATAAKIESIKRLRPLSTKQPWGIFFVKFEPKRLPVVALRRLLSQVALKKRASANSAERAAWAEDDLLFISNYGEGDERRITFAHFSQVKSQRDLPTLKVLGWDNLDTPLHLDGVAETLSQQLAWPEDEDDVDSWREAWRAAFTLRHREVITTSRDLSLRLAGLARAIRDRIQGVLAIEAENGPVTRLMKAFQETLIHDLDADDFADMYAQTIAYGLLSARITNPRSNTQDDFAAHMRTNPFLRELMETFLHVGARQGGPSDNSGVDFDELGVAEVVELLDESNMEAVVRDFGDRNPLEDPVIHFYELFLKEYDAGKRMQLGVFYTPRPVVSYIIRSADEIARTDFLLEDGLADTTTWAEMATRHADFFVPAGVDPDEAFIQILDPATGTGTFLVEAIDLIHRTLTTKWQAEGHDSKTIDVLWNDYVPEHLLPRLHGYELLMAPYAIAHVKVGLKLYETGYHFRSSERARIYLTNSLDPVPDETETFAFAIPALAHEARAVNAIKQNQRFTVVFGNPPYSILSANLDDAQRALVDRYRLVDGERIRERGALQFEKNIQDDYVKFFALAEHLLGQSPYAILAYISNRNYLDASTLRGLRASLCASFNVRQLLDLHGDGTGRGVAGARGDDENVFDILQGVAVGIFARDSGSIRTFRADLGGSRSQKFTVLSQSTFASLPSDAITPAGPQYEFVQRDEALETIWQSYSSLDDIFSQFSAGIITARDRLVIDIDREKLVQRIVGFRDSRLSDERLLEEFGVSAKKGWDVKRARADLANVSSVGNRVRPLAYRPLDERWIFYEQCLVWGRAYPTMQHALSGTNILLAVCKQLSNRTDPWAHVFVTRSIAESGFVSNKSKEITTFFPLVLDNSDDGGLLKGTTPNLSSATLTRLAGLFGVADPHSERNVKSSAGYLYGVLHSSSYRARFGMQLSRSFPRVPLTDNATLTTELAELGLELIDLHLMESPRVDDPITTYIGRDEPAVERVGWADDTVWLDAPPAQSGKPTKPGTNGFHGVSESVWNFRIGAYQVARKWLKDRGPTKGQPGKALTSGDIAHYHRIVIVLHETIRIMERIDECIDAHGGWPDAFSDGE